MNRPSSRQTLLAINSTEWLNMCARGSIRMSRRRRRPIVVASSPTDHEMDKVFVSAPFTKVGSSVDLFILKISDNWTKSKLKHRSNFSEVLLLQLSDVISHHPATQEHFEYYSDIAHKCQVQLDKAKFEHFWLIWTVKETISS